MERWYFIRHVREYEEGTDEDRSYIRLFRKQLGILEKLQITTLVVEENTIFRYVFEFANVLVFIHG